MLSRNVWLSQPTSAQHCKQRAALPLTLRSNPFSLAHHSSISTTLSSQLRSVATLSLSRCSLHSFPLPPAARLMVAAAVAALIATFVIVVPTVLILLVAVAALCSRPRAMSTATTSSAHPINAEGKEEWSARDKEESKSESEDKSKRYDGEVRSSAGSQSPAPEPYTVSLLRILQSSTSTLSLQLESALSLVSAFLVIGAAHGHRYAGGGARRGIEARGGESRAHGRSAPHHQHRSLIALWLPPQKLLFIRLRAVAYVACS